jgi:hypothetical protein
MRWKSKRICATSSYECLRFQSPVALFVRQAMEAVELSAGTLPAGAIVNAVAPAEGLAQIVRTGRYRAVHVKSFDSHRARALLGARSQLVGMTTRLSNHIVRFTRTLRSHGDVG